MSTVMQGRTVDMRRNAPDLIWRRAVREISGRDGVRCCLSTFARPQPSASDVRPTAKLMPQRGIHTSSLSKLTLTRHTMPKSVRIERASDMVPLKTTRTAYVALGSNMGDRVAEIEEACNQMDQRGLKVKRTSSLWETQPMYVLDQDAFLNGVAEIETDLEPLQLLDELQDIERSMGRKKVVDKGPRNVDLDILLYDTTVFKHDRLSIPHIGISEREFVLRPLSELIPSRALYPDKPWKLTQDYLNDLPASPQPLTTITPVSSRTSSNQCLRSLDSRRRTQVMAILNMTPDSFSDGGAHLSNTPPPSPTSPAPLAASTSPSLIATIKDLLASDAAIIDVGGQSTAPNRPEVTQAEELSRVIPAIKLIRSLSSDILISIDTYRASVAEAACAAGADIINDVSAGTMDPDMLSTMARLGKTVCLMHMRGTPATMSGLNDYGEGDVDLIPSVANELLERVKSAEAAGIRRWRIILDPGIGFAKVGDQNVKLLRHLDELRNWPGLQGLPWLVGASRKTFVGKITGVKTPRERIWGTAATVTASVQGGADIVRVHDVAEMAQAVKMSDAIWRY